MPGDKVGLWPVYWLKSFEEALDGLDLGLEAAELLLVVLLYALLELNGLLRTRLVLAHLPADLDTALGTATVVATAAEALERAIA